MASARSEAIADERIVAHEAKATKLGTRYSQSPPPAQKKRKLIEDVSNGSSGKAKEHVAATGVSASESDDEERDSSSDSSSEADSEANSDSDSDEDGINTAALIELLTAQAAQADSAHQQNHPINQSSLHIPGSAPKKPDMKSSPRPGLSIRDRVAAFLPELAAANQELEELRRNGGLDAKILDEYTDKEGEGGGGYIEMDLGLGVLEEKNGNEESESDSDSDTGDAENDDRVMDDLMGRKGKREAQAAGIEEV
ncbi:hypothetical protein MBLNU457_3931t1 [Dothideomycetes sp. NU457]